MTSLQLPPSLAAKPNIAYADQTLEQLQEERAYWDDKIDNATGWGAACGFAVSCIRNIDREIKRRSAAEVAA